MVKKILVIDDDPFIRDMLNKMLDKLGYQVIAATGGDEGIQLANRDLPDVILLDMMMPDVDGYQVCGRLKNSAITRDIPIIFVTAKVELEDQVQGLKLGAHDYICKPIRAAELMARVESAMRVKHLQDQLKDKLRLQEELSQTRQHLMEQYMSSMFGQLAESLVHELNNPLAAVIGFAELIKRRNLVADEHVLGHIEMIRTMGARASTKLSSLLCIAKNDGHKTYLDLNGLVNDVLELINARLLTSQVTSELILDENIPEIKGSANQLARAILALVNNAIDIAEECREPMRKRISVKTSLLPDNKINISVCDFAGKMTPEISAHLFEPFFTTKGAQHTGLGLYMVRSVVDSHNGQIKWEGGADATSFHLILPTD